MYTILVDTVVNTFTPSPDIILYTVVDDEGHRVKQYTDETRAYAFVDMMNARYALRAQ